MTEFEHNMFFSIEEIRILHKLVLKEIVAIKAGESAIYYQGDKRGGDCVITRLNNKLERIL